MQSSAFFSHFPTEVVQAFEATGVKQTVKKGERLYNNGDTRDKFFYICDGLTILTQHVHDAHSAAEVFKTLGTCTAGDCIGETAFFKEDAGATHNTQALALSDTTCIAFDIAKTKLFFEEKGCTLQLFEASAAIVRDRFRGKTTSVSGIRQEKDSMGKVDIPRGAYYGIQTQRAISVLQASGVPLSSFPYLVEALCIVKKASAKANIELGFIDPNIGSAICHACDEIRHGNLRDHFCVDMLQGGAGVSTMANANEVIANRATELLGGKLGEYKVHPNEHVNKSQSDDAYHTVIRLSIMLSFPSLKKKMGEFVNIVYKKALEFKDVLKLGRTMMQDAVPTTLGREFLAWGRQLESDWNWLATCANTLNECLLGGTMMGTGLGADPAFGPKVLAHLKAETGIAFETPKDLFVAATDMSSVLRFSAAMRGTAVRVSKICNDLRLLSCGPRCGFKEFNLPEMQPGSSIMPGKVNPVIAEVMNQVCQNVIGNDTTVALAAEAGQCNACIFDSVIVYSVLEGMQQMARAFDTLTKHCVVNITANKDRCRKQVDDSVSKLTAALPLLGYEKCSEIAEEAMKKDCPVEDILREKKVLSDDQIKAVFSDASLLNSKFGTFQDALEPESYLQALKGDPIGRVIMDESASKSEKSDFAARVKVIKDKYSGKVPDEDIEKMQALLTNDIFQVLNEDEASKIAAMMTLTTLQSGQCLYKTGDEPSYVYCLYQGVVKLTNGEQEIGLNSDGSCIGHGDMVDQGFFAEDSVRKTNRRKHAAVAEVDCRVYKIALDELKPYINSLGKAAAGRICKRVAITLHDRLKAHSSGESLTRLDGDLLGYRKIPLNVYWGVQTLRAIENFNISGVLVRHFPELVKAYAYIKKACAVVNRDQGRLTADQGRAIIMACDEILAGKLENEFVTDMIQGGAGTSTNMNANEVIANRANEILGDRKGTYKYVHPNDHVNMSQSTNDSYPTSLHLSIVLSAGQLIQKMTKLCTALREKGEEYDHVLKMGRTQIQDAVPVTVGQEFFSWAHGLEDELEALREVTAHQQTTNLGGTAIGTGVAADRDFARLVTTALSDVTGYQFTKPDDLIEASSNTAGMLRFMDTLKSIAVKASKVCWDMRFMSSGPRGGIFEISLPCVQPHTSLIPGKNDPDICEMVQMCAFRVIGGNLASTMASHAGQLELNYAEPLMIYHCLAGIKMLSAAFDSLADNCVKGIVANEAHCKKLVSNSVGIVTCLLPFIGYKNCARAAKIATDNNRSISEVLVTEGFLTQEKLDSLMVPENMVKPVRLAPTDKDAEERVAKVRRTT